MNAEAPRPTQPIDKLTLTLADNVQGRIARGQELSGEDLLFVNKLLKRLNNQGVKLSHLIGEQPTIGALTQQILSLQKSQGKAKPDPDVQAHNQQLLEEVAKLKRELTTERAQKSDLRDELKTARQEKDGLEAALEKKQSVEDGVEQLSDSFEKVSAKLAKAISENKGLKTQFEAITRDLSSLRQTLAAESEGDTIQKHVTDFAAFITPLVPKILDIAHKLDDSELKQQLVSFADELNKALFQIYLGSSANDMSKGIQEARELMNTRLLDGQDKILPIKACQRLNAFGFMIANQIQLELDEVDDPEASRVDFGCVEIHRRLDTFEENNPRYYEIIELSFELKDDDNKVNFRFPFYMVYAPNHFPETPCVAIPPGDLIGKDSEGQEKADLVLGQGNPWFDYDDGEPIEDGDAGGEPHCNLKDLPITRVLSTLDETIKTLQEDIIAFFAEIGHLEIKLTREVQEVLNLDHMS